MTTRRLIHCTTCFPSDKEFKAIWDVNFSERTRTCRCCRTTVSLKALSAAVVAQRDAKADAFNALLAELLAA